MKIISFLTPLASSSSRDDYSIVKGLAVKKNSFPSMSSLLPYLVALIDIALKVFLRTKGITLGGPRLPMSWGLAKDILDVGIVLLFPWDGWVFLIPLCCALVLEWRAAKLVALWLVVSLLSGILNTAIGFDQITILRCAKGVVTDLTIFGAIAIIPVVLFGILKRRS